MFVETKRGFIGAANFENGMLSGGGACPIQGGVEQRAACAAASVVRTNRKIQDLHFRSDAAAHQESYWFDLSFEDPAGHLALGDAFVIPRGPLRDLRARRLNRQNRCNVAKFECADRQRNYFPFN